MMWSDGYPEPTDRDVAMPVGDDTLTPGDYVNLKAFSFLQNADVFYGFYVLDVDPVEETVTFFNLTEERAETVSRDEIEDAWGERLFKVDDEE